VRVDGPRSDVAHQIRSSTPKRVHEERRKHSSISVLDRVLLSRRGSQDREPLLAFALFPNYVGYLLDNGDPHASRPASATGESSAFAIEGMTCEACAVTLRERLAELPGVALVEVSFQEKSAKVLFSEEPDVAPSDEVLLDAIRQAGFTGSLVPHSSR